MARKRKIPSRDEMFKKIMPSFQNPSELKVAMSANNTDTESTTTVIRPALRSKLRLTGEEIVDTPQPSVVTQKAEVRHEPQRGQLLSELRQVENAIQERDARILSPYKNIVQSKLDELMQKFGCCQCAGCKKQVEETTLNELETLDQMEPDKEQATISSIMVRAILRTKLSPTDCKNK